MMEKAKKTKVKFDYLAPDNLVDDYSISQTTLDQVFINFASAQSDDPLREMKSQSAMNKMYSRSFSQAVLQRATSRGNLIIDGDFDGSKQKVSLVNESAESEAKTSTVLGATVAPSVKAEDTYDDEKKKTEALRNRSGSERDIEGLRRSEEDSNLEGKPDNERGGSFLHTPSVSPNAGSRSSSKPRSSRSSMTRKNQQFYRPFMAPPVGSSTRKSTTPRRQSWDAEKIKTEIRDSLKRVCNKINLSSA